MKYFGKLFLGVLLSLLIAFPASAFDKTKVVFTGEYNYERKEIEDLALLNLGGLSLSQETSDVAVWEFLTTVGYKLSDNLTPYLILGNTYLNYDQQTVISTGSGSLSVLKAEFRESPAFTMGVGARGNLVTLENGVMFDYDTRWITFNTTDSDSTMSAINGAVDIENKQKVTYGEFIANLTASKMFCMEKLVDSLTPYLGVRYSHVDLLYKNSNSYFSTESETQGGMISGLVGLGVGINKNWSASVGGIVGQEQGVSVKATFNF